MAPRIGGMVNYILRNGSEINKPFSFEKHNRQWEAMDCSTVTMPLAENKGLTIMLSSITGMPMDGDKTAGIIPMVGSAVTRTSYLINFLLLPN